MLHELLFRHVVLNISCVGPAFSQSSVCYGVPPSLQYSELWESLGIKPAAADQFDCRNVGDGYCEEFPFAPTCRAELRFRLARLSHISLTTYLYSLGLLLAAVAVVMYRRRVVKRRAKQQEHSSL